MLNSNPCSLPPLQTSQSLPTYVCTVTATTNAINDWLDSESMNNFTTEEVRGQTQPERRREEEQSRKKLVEDKRCQVCPGGVGKKHAG
mmetsp:Transcript_131170/g.227083  ORF Transcript_131170/g.227083 Transcript_131170/m.227083 type:complete len:88 (-) Transcript_131170:31-294(-)